MLIIQLNCVWCRPSGYHEDSSSGNVNATTGSTALVAVSREGHKSETGLMEPDGEVISCYLGRYISIQTFSGTLPNHAFWLLIR